MFHRIFSWFIYMRSIACNIIVNFIITWSILSTVIDFEYYFVISNSSNLLRLSDYDHSSSSLSCHANSRDIPDPSSPPLAIVHCSRQVLCYISYRHWASVCMFELVVLPLHVHVKGSTGEHHLWARPYFSSSVPHVWFV